MKNKSNILVTGGSGFIGSHLCEKLLEKKFRVICVDNLITGSERNIKKFINDKNFQFFKADVTEVLPFELPQLSCIFHLASPASPVDYQEHPEETALVNSVGTWHMLKLAKKHKAKFLMASTSEIYGDPLEHPQREKYWGNVNTFGPRSCYDEAKRFAETLTYIYIHSHKLDARIIRIFNTYGPRMQKDDGRVVSNFIMAALKGSPIHIDGDGRQTRSFCYVSDLVEGMMKAMFAEETKGEIFNLGNPNEFSILELANKVIELTKSRSSIKFSGEFRTDDPMRRRPDITKAKETLGWEPEVMLEEGLKKTIEYYKSIKDIKK